MNFDINLVGRKVRLVGDHPHSGETGKIIRVERLNWTVGTGLLIELEDCRHNVERCFVFETEHIELLSKREARDEVATNG